MPQKKSNLRSILPLFLIIFIDSFGLGIIYPIITPIYFSPTQSILTAHLSTSYREFLYGLTLALFPLFTFIGAPILGDLSDMAGRKRILMVSLIGSLIGYIIAAISLIIHSVPLLLLSRIIDGFTSGSQPVAQAAIVDISPMKNKAANLSLMLLSLALGIVVGPIIGGVLSDTNLSPYFSLKTPLLFAAFLAFLNIILLQTLFSETRTLIKSIQINWARSINIFASAFKQKNIRYLAVIFLFYQLGASAYMQFISLFLVRQYHFDSFQVGIFFAYLGTGFVLSMAVLMRILPRFIAVKNLVWMSLIVGAISIFMTFIKVNVIYPWVFGFFVSAAISVIYASMLTLFSDQTDDSSQGWVMGITSAVSSLAWAAMAIFAGTLGGLMPSVPLIIAVIFMVISFLLCIFRPGGTAG